MWAAHKYAWAATIPAIAEGAYHFSKPSYELYLTIMQRIAARIRSHGSIEVAPDPQLSVKLLQDQLIQFAELQTSALQEGEPVSLEVLMGLFGAPETVDAEKFRGVVRLSRHLLDGHLLDVDYWLRKGMSGDPLTDELDLADAAMLAQMLKVLGLYDPAEKPLDGIMTNLKASTPFWQEVETAKGRLVLQAAQIKTVSGAGSVIQRRSNRTGCDFRHYILDSESL